MDSRVNIALQGQKANKAVTFWLARAQKLGLKSKKRNKRGTQNFDTCNDLSVVSLRIRNNVAVDSLDELFNALFHSYRR